MNTFCGNKIQKFDTHLDARTACSKNPLCTSYSDIYCEGEEYWTCTGDLQSYQGCSWEKGIISN